MRKTSRYGLAGKSNDKPQSQMHGAKPKVTKSTKRVDHSVKAKTGK